MIYCNGCSYTYGIGTSPHDEKELCLKNAWPQKLSELLDTTVVNEAIPGSSNIRIFRDTVRFLHYNKPDLVIVMWSDAPRTEFFRPGEGELQSIGMAQVTPQNVNSIKSFYHREAYESYYSFIHSEEKAIMESLSYMVAIKQICEARNIPYISYNFKSNLWRSLERIPRHLAPNKKDIPVATLLADLNMLVGALKSPIIFGVTDDISFASICEKEHLAFSEYSLGHPGIEAHKRMAEIIKEVMEKNGILS